MGMPEFCEPHGNLLQSCYICNEKEKVISSNRVTRKFRLIFHKLSMLLEQGNDYSGTDRDLGNL